MTKILVPLEYSPGNPRVLQLAAAMARALDASITVMHVYAPPGSIIGIVPGATVKGEAAAELANGEELLAGACAVLAGVGIRDVAAVVHQRSSIEGAILDEAKRFDFVIMGTHGRRGFDRAVLGSIAEQVIRQASCPVITVHL